MAVTKDMHVVAVAWGPVEMRQRLLDCIVQLSIYGVLTDTEKIRAKARLMKMVEVGTPPAAATGVDTWPLPLRVSVSGAR